MFLFLFFLFLSRIFSPRSGSLFFFCFYFSMPRSEFHFEDILLDKEVEEDFAELPLQRFVFRGIRAVALLSIFLVGAQMFRIGIFHGDEYALRATANAENYHVIPAARGLILDRFGKTLADTTSAYHAFLFPRELPKDEEEREAVLHEIALFFSLREEGLSEEVSQKLRFFDSRILLRENLSDEDLVRASALTIPGFRV